MFIFLAACARIQESDPNARLTTGWDHFRAGDYGPALHVFNSVRKHSGTNKILRLQATYALATTWNLRRPGNDPVKAKAFYQECISNAPKSDTAAWSHLALGRMIHIVPSDRKPDYPAARAAYQKVIDNFPGHAAAHEAFLYQQSSLVASLKPEDARDVIRNIRAYLARYPRLGLKSPLLQLVAGAHLTLGEQEARLAAEIESLDCRELDPTNPKMNLAAPIWNIANIAEFETGDFRIARKYYERFLRECPDDSKTYGAQVALQRLTAMERKVRTGN
ncbi:MAG: tetratricopeptide repeat protein [Spirochaetia bacterium]|nr:tetratricopeptide repeat protein [Spirochaetia bacterium]